MKQVKTYINSQNNIIFLIFHIFLSQYFLILLLIFGGCCSNILILETIIKKERSAGLLITFFQFLFITLEGLVYNFLTTSTFFIKRNIPLYPWLIIVSLFFISSFLNNKAYNYGIPIPIHIISQSGGTLITATLGWLYANKKVNIHEISAVLILSLGIIISTISNVPNKHSSNFSMSEYIIGIIILIISQILRSFMSIYMEKTFKLYSPNWKEVNFYMHFFSLLFYIPMLPTVYSQIKLLLNSNETSFISQTVLDTISYKFPYIFSKFKTPEKFTNALCFIANVITLSICVQGINRLNVISTALTANIILSLRKFISLILSIYIFGNEIYMGTILGIIFVFTGGLWYSIELYKKTASRLKKD